MSKIKDLLFETIYTVRCPYCDRVIPRGSIACDSCKADFPKKPIEKYVCGGYPCCSPFFYEDKYASAVRRFKFSERGALSKQLCVPVADAVRGAFSGCEFDIITCVPMHPGDRRKRGYNQSELLAKDLSEILGTEYRELLVKHKRNKPQHVLSGREREANVRGVFKPADKRLIEGKRILVVDDILTSGNTLGECARVLVKNKCASVNCTVICTVRR